MMKAFLAAVLSVIAVGVLLIAYGLFNPRVATVEAYQSARPMLASERVGFDRRADPRRRRRIRHMRHASPTATRRDGVPGEQRRAPYRGVRDCSPNRRPGASTTRTARRRDGASRVERAPGRDWKKTAMVIGGIDARPAAGLGAIFGGKKGALIGAAIGGGAGDDLRSQKSAEDAVAGWRC